MDDAMPSDEDADLAPASPVVSIRTEPGEVPPDEAARVTWMIDQIKAGKLHWQKDFDRMRSDMDFASGLQRPGQVSYEQDFYTLNLVLRHIMIRVATLYAKDPRAVYRRQPKLDFEVWDEKPDSLAAAAEQVGKFQQDAAGMGHNGGPPMDDGAPAPAAPMMPPEPPLAAMRLLADYEQGMMARAQAERLGRTLELLWAWFLREPRPSLKPQMKAMVRRAVTCGVAYMKLGFQRRMTPRPDQDSRIADLTQQLATIERLRASIMGDNPLYDAYSRQAAELREALTKLQSQPEVVLREGPVLNFPRATSIIPDPRTRSLRGWVGAGWLAEEFDLPSSKVEEIYHIRIAQKGDESARIRETAQRPDGSPQADPAVKFWQFYDLGTGLMYTVAEGWRAYMETPRVPDAEVEGFFPYYPVIFNEIEHETRIFPPSDVELLRSPQDEYNRLRESLRQHRIANRPLYASPVGAFDKKDKANLAGYDAHDVVPLNSLKEGEPVSNLLQPVQKVPIDPAAYEVEGLFSDVQRATGSQEANIGGTAGATATETSVAEASRMSALSSNSDDLDEVLTEIARDFAQVCLLNMGVDTVKTLVGRGAVWPTLSREEVLAEGSLDIVAGSSGRPNRERDLANFERAAPFLMQIPGIDPEKMAEYALRLLDDKLDIASFLKPGLPSITAMNSQAQPQAPTGDPATDPGAQGGQGAQNAPATDKRPGGAQPAYGPSGNAV